MPGAQYTRRLVCDKNKHTSVVTTGPPEITRHSRTQWFTAYIALSPVIGYRMHTSFFWLRSLVETDSLVGIGLAEGGFMSMEVALGRFGDRRLEKGGRRCMRPSFDVQAPAFDALQGTGPKRFGSRVFCAMKG